MGIFRLYKVSYYNYFPEVASKEVVRTGSSIQVVSISVPSSNIKNLEKLSYANELSHVGITHRFYSKLQLPKCENMHRRMWWDTKLKPFASHLSIHQFSAILCYLEFAHAFEFDWLSSKVMPRWDSVCEYIKQKWPSWWTVYPKYSRITDHWLHYESLQAVTIQLRVITVIKPTTMNTW